MARDPAQAIPWLQKAADNGSSRAIDLLGDCYRDGLGVERDPAQAVACYTRSMEMGFSPAITDLARCYTQGIGVPVDRQKAAQLYTLSLIHILPKALQTSSKAGRVVASAS